jgi:hypothetical protein
VTRSTDPRDRPPRPEPPAEDTTVVHWLDTARQRLNEAAARRRTAQQEAQK